MVAAALLQLLALALQLPGDDVGFEPAGAGAGPVLTAWVVPGRKCIADDAVAADVELGASDLLAMLELAVMVTVAVAVAVAVAVRKRAETVRAAVPVRTMRLEQM